MMKKRILEFIKEVGDKNLIKEGGINQEIRFENIPNSEKMLTPELKKVLFKQWDKVGSADWEMLKFVGVKMGETDTSFHNILDVVYPILRIEWEGGVKGTEAYEDGQTWHNVDDSSSSLFRNLELRANFEYRVIPVGYDFLLDESESFGEHGFSCWNLLVEFRPTSNGSPMIWEGLEIGVEIFENKDYSLQSHRNYDDVELDLLEILWDESSRPFHDYFGQFCEVAVKVY